MKKIINKPYLFFWGLVPLCLIIAYSLKSSAIKISYYGGNFTIGYQVLFIFSTIFFALIGINYFSIKLMDKKVKKSLTLIHISIQTISLFLLFFYIHQTIKETTNFHADFLNTLLVVASFLFLIATFFHLINFFLSLLSKNK